jgi:DNA-binding IscR family transcriptional regulator
MEKSEKLTALMREIRDYIAERLERTTLADIT